MSEVRGSATVGRYVLTLGSPQGTVLALAAQSESSSSTAVARALTEPPPVVVERLEELVEGSATVTDQAERSLELFNALATGRIPDRELIAEEIDSLLDLLRRLDRTGRHEDAIRLARSLSGLLALVLRWAALVETLRIALRAARALGAGVDEAWALHELGTLAAGAGEPAAATAQLEDSLRLRERIGDRAGAETTAVNLDVIRASAASGGGGGRRRWPLVAAGAAAVVLLAAGGLAFALGDGDDDAASTTESTTASTAETTTQGTTTGTVPLPGPASVTEQPAELTSSADATLAFTAGGATGFECSLDGEGFSDCDSPMTYDDLADGRHSFEVRGVNATGAGESARAVWTVDTTAPTVTIDDPTADGATWTFTFTADEPSTFECRVDDDAFATCESGFEWVDPSPGDEHTFEVRATDEAGNVGEPVSETFGNTVD